MPSDKKSRVDQVVEKFRAQVVDSYELDTEVVDSLCEMLREAEGGVPLPTGRRGRAAPAKESNKRPRRKSAYNVYVREQMQDEEIKAMGHRDKMGAIAGRWRQLTDDAKGTYKELAAAENAETPEADPSETSE